MPDTFAGEIRSESHSEIGALIESSADLILERWCERAVKDQPTAQRVHAAVLRDDLGKLLRAIGRALRATTDTGVHRRPALEHGEQRWETGWSLVEVVRDYQLMRLVLLEYLETMLARPLYYREAMAIGVFIDDAIAASITTFVHYRQADAVRVADERASVFAELSRRKDEFLAVLGHELRNPLAPIANSAHVLQATLGVTNGVAKRALDVIDRQISQLTRLVDDMLDLSRIGQGRFELRKSRLVLADIVEQAVQAVAPMAVEREHRLHLAAVSRSLELDADPGRLLQVITNLLNNAVKYTPSRGEVFLTVEQGGDEAVIRVRDTGIGIPADMLADVFELFKQVNGSEQYSEGGLGIGLTLVRKLVEQHGGTITCASEGAGKGSEFVVRLPLATGAISALRIVERKRERDAN